MDTIGKQELWSFVATSPTASRVTSVQIRKGDGHKVASFVELASKVAEIQYRNRDHVLLFRGQTGDYKNRLGHSTLKPTLFRPGTGGMLPDGGILMSRFEKLQRAEQILAAEYAAANLIDVGRLKRHRVVRWSILQHYEVCTTPLLDVTHSLRIAASFATHGATSEVFIFVVGVPNLSGGITANDGAGLQTIRLSSVCPPSALRPHIQEGYLLGEYPEMSAYAQKELYAHYEIDFGRRLVAKFRFNPKSFWRDDTFPLVSHEALYPTPDRDPLNKLAQTVASHLLALPL